MDTQTINEGLIGIEGPLQIHLTNLEWGLIILGSLVTVAGLVFFIKKYLKRKTHKKAHKTPYQVASEKLHQLKKDLTQADDKTFTTQVSDILRQYLEKAFALPAPERTTEEFLNDFSDFNLISKEASIPLADFLQSCDLVKFAKQSLTQEQRKRLIESAENIVYTTHREKAYAQEELQKA